MGKTPKHDAFAPAELALVLSHYDVGIVGQIWPFARGSQHSPKVIVDCERGQFLLKRRAKAPARDMAKVAFSHQIQHSLASKSFPLPHLLPVRDSDQSMLVLDGRVYEMFEYIEGDEYDASLEATYDSGRILGLFHKLLRRFSGDYKPARSNYHAARAIRRTLLKAGERLSLDSATHAGAVSATIESLEQTYLQCAEAVSKLGIAKWPGQIVHGDWHPGNMLFRSRRVVGVVDYDSARLYQRVIDLANGALQFSIIGGGDDPRRWPAHLDLDRFKRFMLGYREAGAVSKLELKAIAHLMCEALIAEAALPIAAKGAFGHMAGLPFLQMIGRKVKWIAGHQAELESVLEG